MEAARVVEVLHINTLEGIVFPADRSMPPQECNFCPRTKADYKGPAAVTYAEIDELVALGYVAMSEWSGHVSVYQLYKGRQFYLLNSGRKNRQYLYDWRQQWVARVCCSKALPLRCVCLVSTICPDHGSQCHGTHH